MAEVDVVFLAGGPRCSPLESATGWPLFHLPISQELTLLAAWKMNIEQAFLRGGETPPCSWRVLLSMVRGSTGDLCLDNAKVIYEPRSHRGTAGALSDDARRAGRKPRDLLVVELSACPAVQLDGLIASWKSRRAESRTCVIGESSLRRYCGVSLFDRCLFNLVPEVGFFDFKEQLLPALRNAGGVIEAVTVAERARRIRTRTEWIEAVGAWRQFTTMSSLEVDRGWLRPAPMENGSVVSSAAVTAGATIVSSIVMDAAVVEPGALVARSVIGPGVRIPAHAQIIDAVVANPASGDPVVRQSKGSTKTLEALE